MKWVYCVACLSVNMMSSCTSKNTDSVESSQIKSSQGWYLCLYGAISIPLPASNEDTKLPLSTGKWMWLKHILRSLIHQGLLMATSISFCSDISEFRSGTTHLNCDLSVDSVVSPLNTPITSSFKELLSVTISARLPSCFSSLFGPLEVCSLYWLK